MIVFPDAEQLVVAYLRAVLPGSGYGSAVVGTKVRNPRPDLFVQVLRAGGVERDFVTDAPLLVVHSWALLDVAASLLARTVQGLLKAAPDEHLIGGHAIDRYIPVGGIQNNPDPDSSLPRYTFSAQLEFRGAVV